MTMKKVLKGLSALLAAALFCPAHAGTLLDVELVSRTSGTLVPVYFQAGNQYAQGSPGERYSVRLSNRSGERVLAVLSVDGVNAVSGETADTDQAGYVLEPWQTLDVAGWRKSTRDVARFYFTQLPESYAARTGRAANVGVIGVAVFRERVAVSLIAPLPQSRAADSDAARGAPASPGPAPLAPSAADQPAPLASPAPRAPLSEAPDASAAAPAERAQGASRIGEERIRPPQLGAKTEPLGTGHGEREAAPVRLVNFERATSVPAELHTIWYDSREALVRRGIIADNRPVPRRPEPFPGGFVPDPPCCR
jgi:hypothetical protein